MKEKFEDLILRVVSKHYPYVKRITFITMEDPNDQQYSYLKVVAHVDVKMIDEFIITRGKSYEYDYVHYMFREELHNDSNVDETIVIESERLDDVLFNLTSSLTKLLVPNHPPNNWETHIQYVIMS